MKLRMEGDQYFRCIRCGSQTFGYSPIDGDPEYICASCGQAYDADAGLTPVESVNISRQLLLAGIFIVGMLGIILVGVSLL